MKSNFFNKLLGIISIVIALVMVMAIFGKILFTLTNLPTMIESFRRGLSYYEWGKFMGVLLFWTVFTALMILLLRNGWKRLFKRKQNEGFE